MSVPGEETVTRPALGWVTRKNLGAGGWLVRCLLCGKKFNRAFMPDRYDDPVKAVSAYVGEHLVAPEHAAAVEAYRKPATLSPEEVLLRKIFGDGDPDEDPEVLRRKAARAAAEQVARRRRR